MCMLLLWRLQHNNNAKWGYTIPLAIHLSARRKDTSANFLSTNLVLASEQRHIKFYHHAAKSLVLYTIADNDRKMLIGASEEERS